MKFSNTKYNDVRCILKQIKSWRRNTAVFKKKLRLEKEDRDGVKLIIFDSIKGVRT